jgi:hypothetical protein
MTLGSLLIKVKRAELKQQLKQKKEQENKSATDGSVRQRKKPLKDDN